MKSVNLSIFLFLQKLMFSGKNHYKQGQYSWKGQMEKSRGLFSFLDTRSGLGV